jgi:hypothetical protein
LAPTVQAQSSLGQLFNGALNAVNQRTQQTAPQPSAGQLPSGFQPNAAPPEAVEPGLWATKADFLAAARNGDLTGIPDIPRRGDEFEPVLRSITQILRNEYGVPPLPRDRNGPVARCMVVYRGYIQRFMSMVTEIQIAELGEHTRHRYVPSTQEMEVLVDQVRSSDDGCGMKILGQLKPHPYKAALISLMDEYGQATKVYVDAELGRRKAADAEKQARFQAEQNARADAQAKQDAEAGAAEQQRIDEERARIQSEQKKREEQDKNRVGG